MNIESLVELIRSHGTATWAVVFSIVMFIASIPFALLVIVYVPPDYLSNDGRMQKSRLSRRPVIWLLWRIAKNLLGFLLMVAGFVMLFAPGQGVLFIFLGITMLEFPGKTRLIRRMLQQKKMLKIINGIRARVNRPPLETAV